MERSKAKMKESTSLQLEAPRFENGKALLLAGLRSRYTSETMNGIPAQWERFAPHIGKIPGPGGRAAYGACWNFLGGIDYLTGVEVRSASGIPDEFTVVDLPEQKYAVFPHREHVSRLRETLDAIGNIWVPESGHAVARGTADAPDFFERYSKEFDPRTGRGGMEVWIPIKS